MTIVPVDFDMDIHIEKEVYYILEDTITVCVITDKYGFKHKGESFCAKVEDFNKELGEKYSRKAAVEAMIPYYVFLSKHHTFIEANFNTKEHHSFHIALGKVLTGNYSMRVDIWRNNHIVVLDGDRIVIIDELTGNKYPFDVNGNTIPTLKWLVKPYSEVYVTYYSSGEAIEKMLTGEYKIRLDNEHWDKFGYYVILDDNNIAQIVSDNDFSSAWNPLISELSSHKWVIEKI